MPHCSQPLNTKMPLPRVSIGSFLAHAKVALKTAVQESSPVTFVVGNESAGIVPFKINFECCCLAYLANTCIDLDSLCSALVFAYLHTYTPLSRTNTLYIPLANLPQSDLCLRPELVPILSHANLKPSDLITLSDLPPMNRPLRPENTKWLLVDHNAVQGDLELYRSRVIGCIDHHDEEGTVPWDCGSEPRIVARSGSCSSLVIDYCKQAWDSLVAQNSTASDAQNAEIARLAIAPILIDTFNMTSKSKVTQVDIDSLKYLESMMSASLESSFSSKDYFEEIQAAKEEIGVLGVPDILRKDYKQWNEGSMNLGVCSVVKDINFLIEKAGGQESFFEAVKNFAKERQLSICSIMTKSHPNGEFRRELFIWALDEQGKRASRMFGKDASEVLGLREWGNGSLNFQGENEWRSCWWQTRIESSRKQVGPLLRDAMK